MATTRTRSLLTGSAIAVLMSAGSAFAQDATIHYETPLIQSGQPVKNPTRIIREEVIEPSSSIEAGASTPATPALAEDAAYLGTPIVQISSADNTVSFVSGGTGASEKAWFREHASEFNLKATYNDTAGHNLANVNVTLADSSGTTVLSTTTDGPFLLVKAKPGSYTLTSNYEGASQSKKVTLGKGTANVGFAFTDTNPDM